MEDDQEKLLEQATSVVKSAGVMMQRSFDTSKTADVIKYAVDVISELKTSSMSPKTYYELYMQVFDQLSRLVSYFFQEYSKGVSISDLYDRVQHVPSILPRLYLLVTVGSVYISANQIKPQEMLKDLMEMAKGVQHPIRGLFLRYYLNKMCKDKLPDSLSDPSKGTVDDSIEFLLNNFSEMCRLWVRMQHTGGIKDKTKREKERSDLRVTVGENIVRLSSIEGVTLKIYMETVLPRSLEVIVSSKDAIAQQYLMDCMIQAFPDEYHLNTLNPLLEACTQLQPSVEIKGIFINLMNRLSDFAGEQDLEIVRDIDIYALIKTHVDKLLAEHSSAGETSKFLQLFVAFLRLSLKCYPDNNDHASEILSSSLTLVSKESSSQLDAESLNWISKLLIHALESLGLSVLEMSSFPKLMGYLQFAARKKVALKIVQSVVAFKASLLSTRVVTFLIEYIATLTHDLADTTDSDPFEFEEEQEFTARLVHLVYSGSPDEVFEMLNLFFESFIKGGNKRQIYTYPAIAFAYMKLASNRQGSQVKMASLIKIFRTILDKVTKINPELGYKLSLQCALCVDRYDDEKGFEEDAYELASDALIIYQDSLTDLEARFSAIKVIAPVYASFTCFDEENTITLYLNCAQYAAKTLRKHEHIEGNALASKLFWNKALQDPERCIFYMNKAVNLAKAEGDSKMLVYLLNMWLEYGLSGLEFDKDVVNEIVQDVKKRGNEESRAALSLTLNFIRSRQQEGNLSGISY